MMTWAASKSSTQTKGSWAIVSDQTHCWVWRRVSARRSQVAFMRGAWTAVRRILVPVAWKTASNEAVKSGPRSRIRNLMSSNRSPRVRGRLRACCPTYVPRPHDLGVPRPHDLSRVWSTIGRLPLALPAVVRVRVRRGCADLPARDPLYPQNQLQALGRSCAHRTGRVRPQVSQPVLVLPQARPGRGPGRQARLRRARVIAGSGRDGNGQGKIRTQRGSCDWLLDSTPNVIAGPRCHFRPAAPACRTEIILRPSRHRPLKTGHHRT